MSAVWTPQAFEPLVERLRKLGADARPPRIGEDTDLYLGQLLGWVLDVLAPNDKARAAAYWRMNDPAFRDVPPEAGPYGSISFERDPEKTYGAQLETPKPHVTEESGRSYRIEAAVVDGQVVKPGELMPPAQTVWTAQHDAKQGEHVKVAGYNPDGTANLSRLYSIAGADIRGGKRVRVGDDQTVFPIDA